ncbi:hypothetical protein, partial [Pseudomonas sp. RW409]|uniref:hypothetical protein n=1 Tax=Pseudomonas sp. RW409 TaxID=2202895 RepID=UPI001C460883
GGRGLWSSDGPFVNGGFRPEADHGHAVNDPVIRAKAISLFLLVPYRVSGATLKPNKELRVDKKRHQTQVAKNHITCVV